MKPKRPITPNEVKVLLLFVENRIEMLTSTDIRRKIGKEVDRTSIWKTLRSLENKRLIRSDFVRSEANQRGGRSDMKRYSINLNISALGRILSVLNFKILQCDYHLKDMELKGITGRDYDNLKQERRSYGHANICLRKAFGLTVLYGQLYIRGLNWNDLRKISEGRSHEILYYLDKLKQFPIDWHREEMIRDALFNGDLTEYPLASGIDNRL